MVHLENTEATLTAVVRSHGFPRFLPYALLTVLILTVLALKRSHHAFRYATRVRKRRPQMTQVRHQAKAIECDKIEETFHGQRDALDELLVDERLLMPVEDVGAIAYVLPVDYQE